MYRTSKYKDLGRKKYPILLYNRIISQNPIKTEGGISMILTEDEKISNNLERYCEEHEISRLMKKSNIKKGKGISALLIFKYLFILVFTGKNLYRLLQGEELGEGAGKDTIYRFLNSPGHNWRKFLFLLSSKILDTLSFLTSRDKVLIIDDSMYSRNRSAKVELLARVYDHVEKRYCKGFRMLTLGWSDGATFLPLGFSLLSSENEKNRLCEMRKDIDKRTNGYKRRRESTRKATDVLFELLEQAKDYGIKAQYLLFDRWFSFPSVIQRVHRTGFNVICMLKNMPKIKYLYEDRYLTLEQLYKAVRKKSGKATILASVLVYLGNEQLTLCKIVFVRDRNSRKWLAILSTSVSIEDKEIVRIYGKRWDIEVFFKMSKSYLQLAKEFQGRSYDAMTAHTTIVCCRYIMLAMEKRKNEDERTIGELFYLCCDEIRDINFSTAFRLLLEILTEHLKKAELVSKDAVQRFLTCFIDALPPYFKGKLAFPMCES
jgi:hypothetical protein